MGPRAIRHSVSVYLTLLASKGKLRAEQQNHNFQLSWSLQAHPQPNSEVMCTAQHKNVDPPKRAAMGNELGVYVHVYQFLNHSVRPYAMYSRFGLYADDIASEFQYIRPVSYGYDLPKNKRTRKDGKLHGTQLGGEVGMANAKPTFKISGMKSWLTTSGNETTDEDGCLTRLVWRGRGLWSCAVSNGLMTKRLQWLCIVLPSTLAGEGR
ncbi:hypothetical protein DL96DRAFT_1192649 [Flagelloscypha sp. PMI_526]|nr:hypothetical protein DL96DRAFT_1192649 [Flagelloscypha sp. PMI_526]